MPSFRVPPRKWAASLRAKRLLIFVSILLLTISFASATDPLGATLHKDGTTTFRVWAPFVDSVSVKINDGAVVPLTKEPGHTDPADTTWVGTVAGTKAGDQYRYVIRIGSVAREFNDPRAQQLTGFELRPRSLADSLPKRRRRPGVRMEDLPPIDAVLISHNHFENLNLPTLRQLGTRGPSAFVVV